MTPKVRERLAARRRLVDPRDPVERPEFVALTEASENLHDGLLPLLDAWRVARASQGRVVWIADVDDDQKSDGVGRAAIVIDYSTCLDLVLLRPPVETQ